MTREWSVREGKVSDLGAQATLFNECFGKEKDEATFRWKYTDNPDGPAICRVACDPAGEVVGSYAYMPRRFRRDGLPVVLMQASDAMTTLTWRGRRIFSGLDDIVCEAAGESGHDWAFAYSGRLSFRGFLRNGWKCLGYARLFRCRFKSRRSLLRLGRVGPLVAAVAAPILDVGLGWKCRRRLAEVGTLARIDRFDDGVDDLFDATCPAIGLVGERSAEWLNWRYVDTPTKRQECFGLWREGKLDGYFVAEFHDGNGFLVDHLARTAEDLALLLEVFTAMAWGRGMEEATALHFDHHPVTDVLLRLGYKRPFGQREFRDVFPWIVRSCHAASPDMDLQMERWHVSDGDRDAEHMSV